MPYNVENSSCFGNSGCTFKYVNGGILTGIGIIGILLNTVEIYFLCFKVFLSKTQTVFVVNVALNDLLVAVVGMIRGLGIISSIFLDPDSETGFSIFCSVYAIFLNSVTSGCMLVLLPLTIDRFLAIVAPLHHRYLITHIRSRVLVLTTWALPIFLLFFDTATFLTGHKKIEYNARYHRCVSKDKVESIVVQVVAIIVPLILIPCMYIIMLVIIFRHKVRCKRFFITSTAIIITGILAYLPSALASMFNIPMSYEFSQIATVTIYYSNPIMNPIIYFCSHPKAKQIFKETARRQPSQNLSIISTTKSTSPYGARRTGTVIVKESSIILESKF